MELSHKNSSWNENIPPRVIPGGISTVSQNCPHVRLFFFLLLLHIFRNAQNFAVSSQNCQ